MKRVLIVDDQAQNRYMLEVLLKGSGYAVVTAGNGAEALKAAMEEPPDVIVTDILMPVMDGFALCRQWKADEMLSGIPFIFYTATYTQPKDEQFALSLGADRFILKPSEPQVLVEAVKQVLQERSRKKTTSTVKPLGEEMEFFRFGEAVPESLRAESGGRLPHDPRGPGAGLQLRVRADAGV